MVGLYVINSLEGGGAERVFSQLIGMLGNDNELDHSIEVILLDKREIKYPLPRQVKVHQIDISSGKPALFLAFIKLIKQIRPAYVVSFLTRANNLNILANLFYRYRSIISERSNTNGRLGGGLRGQIKRLIVKILYKRAATILAVSQGVKDCLVDDYAIKSQKIEVLNNPYDLNKIKSLGGKAENGDKRPIIAMGRLIASKRFDNLIRAYAESGLDCGLQILGQGPDYDKLKALAISLGIQSQVEFLGFQSNPYQYIQNSLLFVLSSRLEGFPNALVEAMVLGKAVIATDCTDGPKEILKLQQDIGRGEYRATEYGIMVQVDDIVGLAEAMKNLAQNDEKRRGYEKQSRIRANDFDSAGFYRNFKTILDKQLS